MDWAAIVSYIFGATGFAGMTLKFWLDRNKQIDAQAIAERDQRHAQELSDEVQATKILQIELERQASRIDKVERDHAACMQSHIEEARRTGMLEGRVTEQSATIAQQAATIAAQNTTIAELKATLETYTKRPAA